MLKVGINGACGRMGARLTAMVAEAKDMDLACALEYDEHPNIGQDVGPLVGAGELGVALQTGVPEGVDVFIDFTAPAPTVQRAKECAAKGTALVIGTTGLTEEDLEALKVASGDVACLVASNMSLGVNLLFNIAPQIAKALGGTYDIEIVEAHHRFKKDAPSGTALRLAEAIAEGIDRDPKEDFVYGRQGIVGERTQREIGIHAIRAGDIVGEHTVFYSNLGERIELTHRAHSRDVFCRGALEAARFLAGKPAGMYTMNDVLGLA